MTFFYIFFMRINQHNLLNNVTAHQITDLAVPVFCCKNPPCSVNAVTNKNDSDGMLTFRGSQ
jgi:hypothetical protein